MTDVSVQKDRKRASYIFAAFALFAGVTLSFIAFSAVRKWEVQNMSNDFNRAAESRYSALQKEIEIDLNMLLSVQAFFLHTRKISRTDFHNFAKPLLSNHISVQAFEWLPRVPFAGREEYEREARMDGFSGFQITEQAASGRMVRAGSREDYFPGYYIEPYEDNRIALGFDLASNPVCMEALKQSLDSGEVSTTGRLALLQSAAGDYGFMLIAPLYKKSAAASPVPSGRKNAEAFVAGVFRIEEVVQGALAYLESEALDLYIFDQSAPKENNLIYLHQSPFRKKPVRPMRYEEVNSLSLKYVNTINLAGHRHDWLLVIIPTPEFVAARKTWVPKAVLSGGLLLTVLLVGYLWSNIRRAEYLSNTNNQLLLEIAERKRAEEMLEEREHRLRQSYESTRTILDSMHDSVSIIDVNDFTIVYVNKEFMRSYGIKEKSEVIGRPCYEVTHNRSDTCSPPDDICPLVDAVKNNLHTEVEHVHYGKNGERKCVLVSASPIRNEKGDIIQVVHVSRDFAERKRYEEELQQISITDELTGLFNRRGFYTLAEQQLRLSNRAGKGIYMLYTDLNGFKRINDNFGHREGDTVLKEAAAIIKECFRDSDVVARIGGDEFVVIPAGVSGDKVDLVIERLRKKVESHNEDVKRPYKLSLSIGTAYYDPSNPCSLDELLTQGDKAMYEDKKKFSI